MRNRVRQGHTRVRPSRLRTNAPSVGEPRSLLGNVDFISHRSEEVPEGVACLSCCESHTRRSSSEKISSGS